MKTILIADDKASSREMIATVLERCGYRIVEAANGQEALERARAERADLLLLDLQMPLLDGYGVATALRGDPEYGTTPIVALTAYAMPGDRERALAAGFTSYMTKPVSLAALRQEVQRMIGRE